MQTKEFISQLEDARIVEAIAKAEACTSGEIRIFISHAAITNPLQAAEKQFQRLRMRDTRDRNGVMIFVAPLSQNFAVVGDEAIHARCGADFWRATAADMTRPFKEGRYTDGIIQAISKIGELLSMHFPRRPDDTNELPNRVERG